MDEKRPLEKTLNQLIEEIADLPHDILSDNQNKPIRLFKRGNKESLIPLSKKDCLDELRLYLKYLLFDLEATRRENRCLKKLLDGEQ